MTILCIKVGRTYRAKTPLRVDFDLVNDRQVVWMDAAALNLRYDDPSVRSGKAYPCMSVVRFAAWAARDVTDELPAGEWQKYEAYKKENAK